MAALCWSSRDGKRNQTQGKRNPSKTVGVARGHQRANTLKPYSQKEETQAGIKIATRNINNLRYADDTTLMAESEELKSLLMKVKEESEKVG